jgi:hypothetical protein
VVKADQCTRFTPKEFYCIPLFTGGFHFEVDDGKLRWFHRNQDDRAVFDVTTSDSVVRPNTWHHVMGTYDSTAAQAKVM